MDYITIVNKTISELKEIKEIRYKIDSFLKDYIMPIDFHGNVLPSVKIFINETETMHLSYGLNKLVISVTGIFVNDFFINMKHIEDITVSVQTINIFINIRN